MGTLGVERGISTVGQQMGFQREFESVLAAARANGSIRDPRVAARITDAWIGLQLLRYTARATLGPPPTGTGPDAGTNAGPGAAPGTEASIAKLQWARWHQRLGELAVDVAGASALLTGASYDLSPAQRLFLHTRADTIYGGSSEIQRNIIAERRLGLPRG
jgi:alkylation response protein AidB-like acyl-CoA dehydrogenase